MLSEKLKKYSIILGSQSPRRKELLASIDVKFKVKTLPTKEVSPNHLTNSATAEFLSRLKADAFTLNDNELLITADTIVCLPHKILGKPKDTDNAFEMLQNLSGKTHEVITGVTIKTNKKIRVFSESTTVYFKNLTAEEINYYVEKYKPFDKAGSYGIQEWIGQIGITKIEGSYFNVMGLPTQLVYSELMNF